MTYLVTDTRAIILLYLYWGKGITSTCFLLICRITTFWTREFRTTKEGNHHVRVLLNCTARKTAILTDICQLLLCHSQNGDGREDGDAEQHFTARMRWLQQQHHWEVSSCLWTGWLSSSLHQQVLPNNTSRIIDLLLLLFFWQGNYYIFTRK